VLNIFYDISEQEVANTVVGLDIAVAAVGMPSGFWVFGKYY